MVTNRNISKISYITDNQYNSIINNALFEFCIQPLDLPYQRLLSEKITCSIDHDLFEFKTKDNFKILQLSNHSPFSTMALRYEAELEMTDYPLVFKSKLSSEEEFINQRSLAFEVEHQVNLKQTNITKLAELPEGCPEYDQQTTLMDFLTNLNTWINGFMRYQQFVTTVDTTAAQVAIGRLGVCQDYTHLFLGIARFFQISCRYVSGYIVQDSDKIIVGNTFMHAWVEAFIPAIGWIGFDPTNNLFIDNHFVKVAHGTDYNDCKPIKGILYSDFTQLDLPANQQ